MSPEIIGAIGIAVLLILLFSRMWIGFAMGIVGFVGYAVISGLTPALSVLTLEPYRQLSNYIISVLPMFIFMGVLTSNTGISEDLYRSTHTWVGQLRGGLAMATTFACALFAAICGSSLAGTITMGKVAVPEMKKYNYDDSLATACVAAGGTLGILIPPSIGFILYAILTELSVGKLFMAGIGPGILLTLLICLIIGVIAWFRPALAPPGPKTTFKDKVKSLKHTWAMVAIFLLVMGGIYGGIFTPTEAGAIGAFGAIIVSIINRRLTRKRFVDSVVETVQTTGMIAGIIIGAFVFMRFMTVSHLPFALSEIIEGLPFGRYIIFAVIVFLYIILGMFTDIIASIVITIPVIYPVILSMGFDPIWFGVIVVIVMEMGMITPPIGMNVFVLAGITNVSVGTIFRGVWPFVLAELICIILLTALPDIALFLPNMM